MRMWRKPEIGDTMFHVCEHLYYVPEHAAPLNEYCVCEATVVGFLKGGYTEVKLVGKNPGGFNTPYHYKMAEVGSKLFFDAHSAAKYAESLTVYAEQHWNWAGARLRRPYKDLWNTWNKQGELCSCAHFTLDDSRPAYTKPDDFCSYAEKQ